MRYIRGISAICFFVFYFSSAGSQITLPRLIRDSMVLQSDTKLKIWGWATKGEEVKIKFNGKSAKTKTGEDGKCMCLLPAMKAGGPYTMEIGGKSKITLNDILIGDV